VRLTCRTQRRCQPDVEIYQKGLKLAAQKGLLPEPFSAGELKEVDYQGKPAKETAAAIMAAIGQVPAGGCVIALQGEATPEKAAVVRELKLEMQKAEVWRMDTFFKAMTFMLLTFSEQSGSSMESLLQRPEMLAAGIEMIEEMGEGTSVGAMAEQAEAMMGMSSDTDKIAQHLPLALEYGQGEVINFVASALKKAQGKDVTVLLDGQKETLQYVSSTYRFQL